jgi:hypothetical protein
MKENSQGVLGADRCETFVTRDQKDTDAKTVIKYQDLQKVSALLYF